MNLSEQCSTCASFAECSRMYGKFMIYRAQGWRDGWKPDDGTDHPICGCRHRIPSDAPNAPTEPVFKESSPSTPRVGGISRADLLRRIAAQRSAQ